MLRNLSELIEEINSKVERYSGNELELSEQFKVAIENKLKSNENIKFNKYTSTYTNANGQRQFFANQFFYLATLGVELQRELNKYKGIILKGLSDIPSNQARETMTDEWRKGNNINALRAKLSQIIESDLELEKVVQFATDYSSWSGAKNIARNDFNQSPIRSLLKVIAESTSPMLSKIIDLYDEDDKLLVLAHENFDGQVIQTGYAETNLETEFKEWLKVKGLKRDDYAQWIKTIQNKRAKLLPEKPKVNLYNDPSSLIDNTIDWFGFVETGFDRDSSGYKTTLRSYLEFLNHKNSPENLESEFKEWSSKQLKNNGDPYAQGAMNTYAQAIKSFAPKFPDLNLGEFNVFTINKASEIENLRAKVLNSPLYAELNKQAGNNGAIKNGLVKYQQFLESRFQEKLSHDPELKEFHSTGINRIYFGAPGTGKSYGIRKFIESQIGTSYDENAENDFVFRTTLHPEFSYHDFVGQVMPVVDESGKIEYTFKPQIFTDALDFALKNPSRLVFLILEEMSRANVAGVFGDLFQLLDRDEQTAQSEYSINNDNIALKVFGDKNKKIFLPGNLYLIGTVNTSDQNVFVMDTAFKRRFEFEYISPAPSAKQNGIPINNFQFRLGDYHLNWIDFYQALNTFIVDKAGLSEDKQLGQFFVKFRDNDEAHNLNQLSGKLLLYLWEDINDKIYGSGNAKLFKKSIKSFSTAYDMIGKKQNVFNTDLMNQFDVNLYDEDSDVVGE